MDEALNAGLQLHECTVIRDVGDTPLETGSDRILAFYAVPWIVEELFHAKRDTVSLVVDLDDLHLHLLADIEHLCWMIDPAPGDVGDVQQPVNASEIHKGSVIGDVLHDAVDHLTFFKILHQLLPLLGARLFEDRTTGHNDIAAATIHLQDLKLLRHIHQRSNVADWTDVDLRSRKKCHRAIEINGEATLDLIEDDSL